MNSAIFTALGKIASRYRLSAVYLFGSRAKEAAALLLHGSEGLPESGKDLDIAVLPGAQVVLSAREKVEISLGLEELFGSTRVDLVVLPEADPFLAVNAIRSERVYCSDEHRADEYELYLLRRAGDLVPLERQRIRMILGEEE